MDDKGQSFEESFAKDVEIAAPAKKGFPAWTKWGIVVLLAAIIVVVVVLVINWRSDTADDSGVADVADVSIIGIWTCREGYYHAKDEESGAYEFRYHSPDDEGVHYSFDDKGGFTFSGRGVALEGIFRLRDNVQGSEVKRLSFDGYDEGLVEGFEGFWHVSDMLVRFNGKDNEFELIETEGTNISMCEEK